jgi:hypothetical protein
MILRSLESNLVAVVLLVVCARNADVSLLEGKRVITRMLSREHLLHVPAYGRPWYISTAKRFLGIWHHTKSKTLHLIAVE